MDSVIQELQQGKPVTMEVTVVPGGDLTGAVVDLEVTGIDLETEAEPAPEGEQETESSVNKPYPKGPYPHASPEGQTLVPPARETPPGGYDTGTIP